MSDRYPHEPGHRGIDTSVIAAGSIAPSVGRLQRLVLASVTEAGWHVRTTNELAHCLDLERSSIQPRTSELRAQRLIIDSGRRRRNANGKRAIVWTTPEHEDRPPGVRSFERQSTSCDEVKHG